ncbi:MAG: ATP synthase F1 subunit epsilon [Fimbriimonadaceae bacterium]|jgi:F-type H+-transporting ATPase subunit epsilon|nr:ATP synthase F1 subunit epsilon [Fimbriimonadaceae bacterium]
MADFKLSVVAPDRTVYEDVVKSVILPGIEGYLGVQSNHEPLIVALRPGIIEYVETTGIRHYVSITGGFAEVSDNNVIVLADEAKLSREIDLALEEKILEDARKALRGEASSMTSQQATAAIERATVRIKTARMN